MFSLKDKDVFQKDQRLSKKAPLFKQKSRSSISIIVAGTAFIFQCIDVCKHSKKCTFYTLRFGCSFAAVNTIKPQLL